MDMAADPLCVKIGVSREDLLRLSMAWELPDDVPASTAETLDIARRLFVHGYFDYSFFTVGALHSLLALEAILRSRLEVVRGPRSPHHGLRNLIDQAKKDRLLTEDQAERARVGADLRNSLVHQRRSTVLTPGMAQGIIASSFGLAATRDR